MKKSSDIANRLVSMYEILNDYFGDCNWWPGETPFEIAVGAILTQNTNWTNVEKAIKNLKSANLLSTGRLLKENDDTVSELIRPSGYYNIKTKRLKAFLVFLKGEYGGKMERMFEEDLAALREKLLSVKGVGEEPADSILLYGGNRRRALQSIPCPFSKHGKTVLQTRTTMRSMSPERGNSIVKPQDSAAAKSFRASIPFITT
jgi:endonuclease III-like uncharacterized protein